ncbi:MAG TPA: GNAT family N-acetyltransferase [Candidatus Blautia gallistercoris]|uniref:GNAT family N-acetyltransferase n=1 Tax=Candidatus Blautia gallistercoris TaxID=2838490 RepID=A0A9D1WGT3_9FIRM|nr:GNAT family N-acetyltransferase [Candidatus Blautia gallistercoris]
MTVILIRNARLEEGDVLGQIENICFPPAEAAEPEMVKARLAAFPEQFFVAEVNGKIAGFINGCVTDTPELPDTFYHDVRCHDPEGDYFTVFGLNVLPEYRRQGIAGRLLEAYIQAAREKGKKGIILTCKDHMVHYYEKFGFVCRGVADSDHGGAVWNDMRLIFTA